MGTMGDSLHQAVRPLFSGDFNTISDSVRARLEQLGVHSGDTFELENNPFNRTHNIGLQSLGIVIKRDGNGLFLPTREDDDYEEDRSPTYGFYAPGMIDERLAKTVKMAEVKFPIEEGRQERVVGLHRGMKMDGNNDGSIDQLGRDELIVTGPDAVRVYIEKKNPSPEDIRRGTSYGVYRCGFFRRKKIAA